MSIRSEDLEGMVARFAKMFADELERCTKSCLTCEHFNEAQEKCEADPQRRRPPARVIAFGCPSYEERLPF